MKKIWFLFAFTLFVQLAYSKDPLTKTSIEVNGNCNMCKNTIEKASSIDGVSKAKWNVKTHQLALSFNPKQISLDQIQLRIAAAGYDTPVYKANDEKYNALH
ncbi:MAG: heavy-metal-associated domain-containing protein, partial [Saprospiraceae bacterium]